MRYYIVFLPQAQVTGHSAWWIFLQTKGVVGLYDCLRHLSFQYLSFLFNIKGFPGRQICSTSTRVILEPVAGLLEFALLSLSLNPNILEDKVRGCGTQLLLGWRSELKNHVFEFFLIIWTIRQKNMWQLNLPTNIYKSSNNKKYQQISTNLPTI